jgi:type I restriction enzyme, S subunit
MEKQMNAPKLRFPEFNGKWEKKKLGEVAELTSSKRVYANDYVANGIPFYRGKEITELKENKKPSDILYISKVAYENFKKTFGVPQINDLLITAVGTLGNILTIKNNEPFYFKDGNLIWLRKVCENSEFLEILLYFNFKEIEKSAIGSSQKALTMVELRKLSFSFPTLPEQTKIANFLSALDTKLQAFKKKKNLLEQYKKGVMQQLFSQELRFKDENGRDFPDWEVKKLGDFCEIIMGQSPSSNSYNSDEIGIPLIQGNADIQNRLSNPRNWTTEKTKECNIGDLILTVRAPVGAVAKSVHNACIGRGVCAIRNNNKSANEYIYQFLLDYETKWGSLEQGSTFTAVSGVEIKKLEINLPSLPEQTKIANFLSAIDDKINNTNSQINQVELWKKGLLQQMFV